MRFSVAAAGSTQVLDADDPETKAWLEALEVGRRVNLREAPEPDSAHRRFVHRTLNRMAPFAPSCNLRNFLAIVTGHADVVTQHGRPYIVPRSFSDMAAVEFEAFWADAVPVLERMLPPPGTNESADLLRGELRWEP